MLYCNQQNALHWYNFGAQFKGRYSTFKQLVRAEYDNFYKVFDALADYRWECTSFVLAGMRGYPFDVKQYSRYGALPMHNGKPCKSGNYREDMLEDGVSVADDYWVTTINFMLSDARQNRELIKFYGIQCGIGSDGEAVVIPVNFES